MPLFGRTKRKKSPQQPSQNTKNRNSKNRNVKTNKNNKVLQVQSNHNLIQTSPPPPYLFPPPPQANYWHPQSPFQQPHAPYASQTNILAHPAAQHHGVYRQDLKGASCTNLPAAINKSVQCLQDGIDAWQHRTTNCLHQGGAALCDIISSKLDTVITSIDGECFSGDERELGT